MATNQRQALKKLQRAINARSESKILVSETEWFSDKRNATITSYIIRKALPTKDTARGRKKHTELFNTTSLIQAVLYLRDYWYSLIGEEIPTDNEYWNNIKDTKGIIIDAKAEEEIPDE